MLWPGYAPIEFCDRLQHDFHEGGKRLTSQETLFFRPQEHARSGQNVHNSEFCFDF